MIEKKQERILWTFVGRTSQGNRKGIASLRPRSTSKLGGS